MVSLNSDFNYYKLITRTENSKQYLNSVFFFFFLFFRSISEHVRRLDDARSCANTIEDLYSPTIQSLRSKFKDYCERLVFAEPLLYGRKIEELLWRKAYYEVIATAKHLKKGEYTEAEKSNIQAHINAGVGYYHHYILRLQTEYDMDLKRTVDFSICITPDISRLKKIDKDVTEWAAKSVHQSLIYLGDLCRYKLEIYPNWSPSLAFRYYTEAVYFKPEYGMPHNQMGLLASHLNLNHSLDSVYYYIRCLSSKFTYDGSENNLHKLFEKNSLYLETVPLENQEADCIIQPEPQEHIKRLISRFLLLVDIWFFMKKIPDIYSLCHQTSVDLRECLSYIKPTSSESGDGHVDTETSETDSVTSPSFLHSDIIFKITVICILCITKLKKSSNSYHMSNVVAFSLALYSQIIQHICNRIQESLLNFPIPPEKNIFNGVIKKKKRLKTRRRRKINSGSESDLSDSENDISSSEESLFSENEIEESGSSEDENNKENFEDKEKCKDLENGKVNINETKIDEAKINEEKVIHLSRRIDVNDMLGILVDEPLLSSVKIFSDWLSQDVEVLKSCGKSSRSLFQQVIYLLNLMNLKLKKGKVDGIKMDLDYIKNNFNSFALSEDVILKGIEIFVDVQKDIDWKSRRSLKSPKEETIIRSLKFLSFGHFLASIEETGVTYNSKSKEFNVNICSDNDLVESNSIKDDTVSF